MNVLEEQFGPGCPTDRSNRGRQLEGSSPDKFLTHDVSEFTDFLGLSSALNAPQEHNFFGIKLVESKYMDKGTVAFFEGEKLVGRIRYK